MIGLYFGGREFKAHFDNEFGNVEFDAVIDEEHSWTAEATTNPVEDGAPVSDHIIEQPDKVRMKCFVSDTPLTASQNLGTSGDYNQSTAGTRTQPVFDLLYTIIKARVPVTIYTKHSVYSDMALVNVTVPRASGTGEALEFELEFLSIRRVATETVDVPAGISASKDAKQGGASGATAKKAEPKKAAGKKQPETVTKPAKANPPAAGEKSQSTLSKWFS